MLRTVGVGRHIIVGLAVIGLGALGATGVIGSGDRALLRPEHFDAKHVVVSPAGPDHPNGVRIREVVDIDFGLTERRGYQRIVPHDFGEPLGVTSASPDANPEVNVVDFGIESRIRIGNPRITFTGQRRYIIEYTLPDANLSSGELALDIIGHEETFVTDEFTVLVDGFDLTDTRCDLGDFGALGGCELRADGDGSFSVVIDRLKPGEGITVGGPFSGRSQPGEASIPALPDRNPDGFRPVGAVMAVLAAAIAVGGFVRLRRLGSNTVYGAGGAADAAFGDLRAPLLGDPVADVPTYRVPDSRLADLATIEFVPPRGLEPWHGRVLLREEVDDETVSAWFSEMVARDAIVIDESNSTTKLMAGSEVARLNAIDQRLVASLFARGDTVTLGKYDPEFAAVWAEIAGNQRRLVSDSGWWHPPSQATAAVTNTIVGILITMALGAAAAVFVFGVEVETIAARFGGFFLGPVAALVATALVMLFVAAKAYGVLRPSRTAIGSALTLRTESFRRFLEASEGTHVDWAWEQGVIREYSAWAVALDAADAWSTAIESSNIPDPSIAFNGPLLVHSVSSSFSSARTAPSSSSSGGGGGGSGGGGGGGSSGSW